MKKLVFVFAALLMENLPDAVSRWHCVGGNLGTRALAKLKAAPAGVQSWVAALGKGELARNVANSKPACIVAAGLLGITIACTGISGCGGDESVSSPVTDEAVEVTDRYVGDNINFKVGDTIYTGYVLEGVSANEVKVRLDDRSTMTISLDRVGGTRIADHSDVGVKVVLLGDRNKGEEMLVGRIVDVFDDDMRKIEITSIEFMDGRFEVLDVRPIRFVDEDTDFEEGGYLTLEEFIRLINNRG